MQDFTEKQDLPLKAFQRRTLIPSEDAPSPPFSPDPAGNLHPNDVSTRKPFPPRRRWAYLMLLSGSFALFLLSITVKVGTS